MRTSPLGRAQIPWIADYLLTMRRAGGAATPKIFRYRPIHPVCDSVLTEDFRLAEENPSENDRYVSAERQISG
jgi:hypothetical protein